MAASIDSCWPSAPRHRAEKTDSQSTFVLLSSLSLLSFILWTDTLAIRVRWVVVGPQWSHGLGPREGSSRSGGGQHGKDARASRQSLHWRSWKDQEWYSHEGCSRFDGLHEFRRGTYHSSILLEKVVWDDVEAVNKFIWHVPHNVRWLMEYSCGLLFIYLDWWAIEFHVIFSCLDR